MSQTTEMKNERIEMRVRPEHRKLLENAADVAGLSVNAFMLSHALEAAKRELESFSKLKLSDRDRDLFLSVLENPPPPSEKLQSAFKKFKNGTTVKQ